MNVRFTFKSEVKWILIICLLLPMIGFLIGIGLWFWSRLSS